MRIILPPKLRAMADQVYPYMVMDGLNVYLSPDAPPEIVEMDKKVMAFYQKQQDDFEKENIKLM